MANPLEALKKAQTIGSGVPKTASLGMMPLTPWSGIGKAVEAAPEAAGALRGLLSSSSRAPAMETLGESLPEYTPVGGEAMYNIGRGAVKNLVDPVEAAFQRLLARGGR